jgi:hypothetical protein
MVWNERNYDLNKSRPLKAAYENSKWSLVSNYVRLDVLKEFGGVYIDADIEVLRAFDDLLAEDFFIGFMWDCTLGTAVIGASPMNKIVCDILDTYESVEGSLVSPNNNTFTDYFLENVEGFKLTGENQSIGGVKILNKFAFEHPTLLRRSNYTIHHFYQSWVSTSKIKRNIKLVLTYSFSLWLYRRYIYTKSRRISKYYDTYLKHTGYS